MKTINGRMSTFGGPLDTGVSPSEGLAYVEPNDLHDPWFSDLFLEHQPPGTTGLARRLDPSKYYIAMRVDNANSGGREKVRRHYYTVIANGARVDEVKLVDWGPNNRTGRVVDMSPGLAAKLKVLTDSFVDVKIPDDIFINA